MKIFDLHSHWGTERGYPLRSKAALEQQKHTWRSSPEYVTEEEMAEYLRQSEVKAILDFGFTKSMSIAEVRGLHDYAIAFQRDNSDVIFGHWLQIDPRTGAEGANELRRCIDASSGFISIAVSAAGMGFPACDPIYDPFYDVCLEVGRPVLVMVGYTGAGAGLRGGDGVRLDLCHPRHVDDLAIRYPDLQIITGRPAWPWQDEMIAVMLHKPNVTCELHGWSPKYLTAALKHDIPRRLRRKVMFGADYPLFKYDRLLADWDSLGYGDDVMEDILLNNALRVFDASTRQDR